MIRLVRVFCSAVIASTFAAASPGSASDWMIIGAEPDPAPHRSLYVMASSDHWIMRRLADDYNEGEIDTARNPIAAIEDKTLHLATVYQVFENAGGTNFILYNVEFKCRQGSVSIAQATSFDRAGKTEVRKTSQWMKVPNNWLGKAEMIACGWKNWQAAQAAWKQGAQPTSEGSKPKKGAGPPASLAALGLEYLGDYNMWAPTEVVDAVWTKRWTDAVQPAYYEGTPEEQAAANAKVAALHDQTKTLFAEQEKWSKIAVAVSDKAERMGGDAAREMGSIGGQTEQQVVARWGAPSSVIESSGVRTLTYNYQKERYGVENARVDVVGAGGKVGETYEPKVTTSSVQCRRTLHLQEGGALEKAWRVYDFDMGCN